MLMYILFIYKNAVYDMNNALPVRSTPLSVCICVCVSCIGWWKWV